MTKNFRKYYTRKESFMLKWILVCMHISGEVLRLTEVNQELVTTSTVVTHNSQSRPVRA